MATDYDMLKKKYANKDVGSPSFFNASLQSNGIYNKINNFSGMYRNGKFDTENTLTGAREFVFFCKPDLCILDSNGNLTDSLKPYPFFRDLKRKYPNVIKELQLSANHPKYPFSNFLFNMKKPGSNIDVPALTSTGMDNPTNVYGTSYEYRGSSEASNDNFSFSIEFDDTRYLDTYMFFRAYDEYETLKSHGKIDVPKKYVTKRILHDAIGIYKFVVAEDGETIVYYAYYCGVTFRSFGRDVFTNSNFDSGISYSIDCNCPFMEDMNPLILKDFNDATESYRNSHTSSDVPIYDIKNARIDGSVCKAAYITTKKLKNGRTVYQLKWRK